MSETWIVWVRNGIRHTRRYKFATEAELNAFLKGVDRGIKAEGYQSAATKERATKLMADQMAKRAAFQCRVDPGPEDYKREVV